METKPFSTDFLESLKSKILQAKAANPGPHYAAFDADGTLWDSDIGEQFFQYQIDHCDLESLSQVDPWEYYNSTKVVDPPKAYLWLAQISAGHPITKVREWAKAAVDKGGARVFESQKKLIAWLQENDIEVFIVTASIKWAVEPAAYLAGVPFENVMGIETKVDDNGIVTMDQHGPITWREGKATALMERTNGVAPIFCSGNTYGDTFLLKASVGEALCIRTQTEQNHLFEEEQKLQDEAAGLNWPTHSFF